MNGRAKVLALLPARWAQQPPPQAVWIAELLRELGRRWGAVAVFDPGAAGEARAGLGFPRRAWRDFQEQSKEAVFENPIQLVLAVGEAAKIPSLQMIAGWAPLVPRVSLILGLDWLHGGENAVKGLTDISDLLLLQGDWSVGRFQDAVVSFVNEPRQACDAVASRFSLEVPCRPAPGGGRLTVVERGAGGLRAINRSLGRTRAGYALLLDGAALPALGRERLAQYLEEDPWLAGVGALEAHAGDGAEAGRLSAAHSLLGKGHREHARFLPAGCCLLRREALARVGFLDERFKTLSAALKDLSFRLRLGGFRLLLATDVVAARGRVSPSRDARSDLEALREKWCRASVDVLSACLGKTP